MSNLSTRFLSSLVLILFAVLGITLHPYSQWLLLSLLLIGGTLEISLTIRKSLAPKNSLILSLCSIPFVLLFIISYIPHPFFGLLPPKLLPLFALAIALIFFSSLFNPRIKLNNRLPFFIYHLGFTFFFCIAIACCFQFFYDNIKIGNGLIWNFLIAITLSDTGAYFTGKLFGKRKVTSLSPNKTLEGFIGGIIISVTLTTLFSTYFTSVPIFSLIVLNFILSVSAIFGDLFFSAIKRHFSIEEFSYFIPGHGGLLDRVDSILFTAPIAYFTMQFIL